MASNEVKRLHDLFHLRKEPGLVSQFMVEEKFLENTIIEGALDKTEYNKKKKETGKASLHAMILIGAYQCSERYWFLLQNSHRGGYFKIVDGEYLASCHPTILFAFKHTDMSLKADLKVVAGEYIEAEFAMEECAVTLPGEG